MIVSADATANHNHILGSVGFKAVLIVVRFERSEITTKKRISSSVSKYGKTCFEPVDVDADAKLNHKTMKSLSEVVLE